MRTIYVLMHWNAKSAEQLSGRCSAAVQVPDTYTHLLRWFCACGLSPIRRDTCTAEQVSRFIRTAAQSEMLGNNDALSLVMFNTVQVSWLFSVCLHRAPELLLFRTFVQTMLPIIYDVASYILFGTSCRSAAATNFLHWWTESAVQLPRKAVFPSRSFSSSVHTLLRWWPSLWALARILAYWIHACVQIVR
jgi:hypothetical protein